MRLTKAATPIAIIVIIKYIHLLTCVRAKKVFRFRINATFVGEFYFPPVYCSQMYNDAINARTESRVVRISK